MVQVWSVVRLLSQHSLGKPRGIDLSNADMDGSHTPAVKGGEAVGYQGRKKRRTTNALYLTDRQGLPMAMSEPVSSNHNDLFGIEVVFDGILSSLRRAKIQQKDCSSTRMRGSTRKTFAKCVNRRVLLPISRPTSGTGMLVIIILTRDCIKNRYSIERTNAWMDSFRSLLNRFDTTVSSWKGFNFLAFIVIGLKRFLKLKKSR